MPEISHLRALSAFTVLPSGTDSNKFAREERERNGRRLKPYYSIQNPNGPLMTLNTVDFFTGQRG